MLMFPSIWIEYTISIFFLDDIVTTDYVIHGSYELDEHFDGKKHRTNTIQDSFSVVNDNLRNKL